MSSGLKRTAAPPVPGEKGGAGAGGGEAVPPKKGALSGDGRSSNGSAPAPLTYSGGEVARDVSTNEATSEHAMTLEVVLPTGASSSVTVDFNTPMRDLLVHLAATFRVAPTAHVLQLLDGESGQVLAFKPSHTIGALGNPTVYMVPKNKKAEWGKAIKAGSKASSAFEITNRFTINLPGGQKAVMRISPQLTLEQVFSRVCQDKSLDSRRYTLQHPDNPLAPLDLKATIAENRLTEINIIHAGASSSVGQASKSMPDLHRGSAASLPSPASQDPASWYMPEAGEPKKKRGFLSFLTKKDKKFKPHDTRYTMAANSPASQPPPPNPAPAPAAAAATLPRKASTPPAQRRAPDVSATTPRPKTLYVIGDVSRGADVSGAGRVSQAPAPAKGPGPGKKRHAPPPPTQKKKAAEAGTAAPSSSQTPPVPKTSVDSSNAPLSVTAEASTSRKSSSSSSSTVAAAAAAAQQASVTVRPSPADAPPGLSRFHSRNSSDSSGYHELTLSGAESPEASRVPTTLKTSIDTTSIESADHPNGDSGIQDVSPPGGVVEHSSVAGQHSDGAGAHPGREVTARQQGQMSSVVGKPDKKPKPPSTKKKKAPPPPPKAAKAAPPPVQDTSSGVASSQPAPPGPTPPPTSAAASRVSQTAPPQHSRQEQVAVSAVIHTHHEKTASAGGGHAGDESDSDSGEPFNLNDILDAVNFEDEPQRTDTTPSTTTITTTTTTTTTTAEPPEEEEDDDSGRMAMIETASVLSENVEDIKSRPCEFIPPPPPEEPPPEDYLPPGEYPPPEEYSSSSCSAGAETLYQHKGTGVGEDNASLAPASLKSSPESKQGYSNEMARFVAQMSRLTTDRPPDGGDLSSNNTSLSLPDTESVSDTGSVVYHARGDSRDSQSSLASVERSADPSVRGRQGGAGVASTFAVMEEIDAPLETVPPPLEFQGEDEEEEEVTVVTEQYISPMGTNFQAAARMPEDDEEDSRKNALGGYTGVFRAEPVSILPPHPTFMEQREEEEEEEKPAAKEEFVLTLEDLSDVSLVPRRPKIPVPPKPILKPSLMEPDPQLEPEPEPVAEGRRTEPPAFARDSSANASSVGYRPGRSGRISTDRRLPQETDAPPKPGLSGDKPVSTLFLPTMRYSHSVDPMSFSDDDQSSVNSNIGEHVHRFSAKAVAGGRAADDVSDASSDRSGGLDSRRVSASSSASQTPADVDPDLSREDVQQQFSTLQDQFVLWQQQLQQNQALLAAHSGGSADTNNDDTLKTLQAQMQMQQQMMMQLQMSMEALGGQQQPQEQQQHSTDISAAPVDIPAPALPAEDSPSQSSMSPPSYPPPPPPISESPELPTSPPPPPPPPAPVQPPTPAPKVIKAETKPKTSRASRFEPKLDPREELMIAIRSFGGHEKLKPVPAETTK